MNKKLFKLSTLAFTVAAMFNTPTFAAFTLTADGFTNNGDGTVTDENTGLVWQACAVGQTFNNSTGSCDGEAKTYTYENAIKLTSDFGGQTDWRVPTISELNSIVDLKKQNPAINKSLFPNPPAVRFWSASPYVNNSDNGVWFVHFNEGINYTDGKNYNYNVRLVRGEQSFYFDSLKLADFVDNKDGTVTHKKTGLTWQRCAVGQTWNSGNCEGKATAYVQEEAAKLTSDMAGQTDWRLPSLRELQTIVDYSTVNPSTNLIIFPDAPSSLFWTTTPKAESNDFWYVSFSNASTASVRYPYTTNTARLVRGTLNFNGSGATNDTKPATGSVDLTAKLSATPTPAKMGGDLTYTATISNKGKATATNATVTFYIAPNFMTFKNASAGCETTRLSVICNVGDLAAGGSTTKTMTVNLKKAGGISSSVLVKSNEQDANPADNVGKVATGVKK